MKTDVWAHKSDQDPKRWEWLWLPDLPDNFVVSGAFTYPTEKAALAAGRREIKKMISYCARLQ